MRMLRTVLVLAALAGLIGLPLGALVREAVTTEGALDAALESQLYRERAIFTLTQAAISTALATALGLLVAYALSMLRFPGRTLVRLVAALPIILPPIVLALGVREALSPLGDAVSPTMAIGFTHVAWGTAIIGWLCSVAWRSADRRAQEAARTLGASRLIVFRRVTWPALHGSFRAAVTLTFMLTLTSFAAPLLLGGPGEETVAVLLYQELMTAGDRAALAVLALGQSLVLLLVVIYASGSFARLARTPRRVTPPAHGWRRMTRSERVALPAALLVVLILIGWPLAALVAAAGSAALDGDGGIGNIEPVRTSVAFAALSAIPAAFIGLLSLSALGATRGWSALLRPWLLAPLLIGPLTLGLGIWLAFGLDLFGETTPAWAVLLAHIAIGCIASLLVIAASRPAPTTLGARVVEAARLLGASPWRARGMRRTSARRLLVIGILAAAMVSLGELGATALLGGETAPVVMLADPEAGGTLVLAVLLLATTVAVTVAIERLRRMASG